MKKWQKNKWTGDQTQAVIGTIVVILCLVGMFYWGKDFGSNTGSSSVKQNLFVLQSSGENIEFAFDNNEDSAWMGSESRSYNEFNYAVIDFGEKIELNKISMILGGSGAPINYLISIQTSNNGNIWTDAIGGIETGFFEEKQGFTFPILAEDTRYLKIGIKPFGTSFQKFRVYEIMVNN